ncbi:MAG: transporter substrate-binding domain-containing protein [Roseibium sp.]
MLSKERQVRNFAVFSGAIMLFLMSLNAFPAAAQEDGFCDRTYKIVPGDTLSRLANRAFGNTQDFMRFYNDGRNKKSLGTNPSRINVGAALYLPPCPGSSITLESANGVTTDNGKAKDPFTKNIDVVTGTDFAPFTSEDMEFGGMLTAVVQEAFDQSNNERTAKVVFINDWGSHLETLLPDHKYDFGFPWYRPDCSDPGALSASMRKRCDLIWSDPLFSVIIGFYTLSTASDIPQDFAGLQEKRLCRPAGYFTFDLEQNGLVPGKTIELSQPNGVDDCFEKLEKGEVDFVTINRFTAEKAIASTGLDGLVVPIDSIVTSQELHLVGHKTNRAAVKLIEQFNDGLSTLEENGRLSSITRYFMAKHQEEVDDLRSQ